MSDMLIGFLLGASLVALPVTVAVYLGIRWARKKAVKIDARRQESLKNFEQARASILEAARRT